ncbi:hypothetical protein XM38_002740 [Halomicronema hongdechloris C2206]|uniref:Uncharacterized protein n=1 Tax=Halomicronema hongdechloris C2206 TaxID=1641165 RepID=A0A1Z3HGK7_9CYAN|nr:hypothetical protein [Halomicronema hongdechloris]ASC69347.1 hypothetical protein XM38_002740 [Halomicronema hongdechloris C2206]
MCESVAVGAATPPPSPTLLLLGHLGLILLAAGVLSLGMFISSLTESTVLSAIMTFVLVFFVVDSSTPLGNALPGLIGEALGHLSLLQHFTDFTEGVLDTSGVVLFASYILLGLFLTGPVRRDATIPAHLSRSHTPCPP